MKPIELGCLVMITDSSDSSHVGLCGTAVEMEKDASHLGCYWKVSVTGHFHNQKCLIRIDGGEDEALSEERERERVT